MLRKYFCLVHFGFSHRWFPIKQFYFISILFFIQSFSFLVESKFDFNISRLFCARNYIIHRWIVWYALFSVKYIQLKIDDMKYERERLIENKYFWSENIVHSTTKKEREKKIAWIVRKFVFNCNGVNWSEHMIQSNLFFLLSVFSPPKFDWFRSN